MTQDACEAKKEGLRKINPHDPAFYILYTDGEVDFSKAPTARVNIYKWGQQYMPRTEAKIIFKEDDGFYVRMECEEKNPLAEKTEFGASVCEDSCMEFFANYQPKTSDRYINIEMNSIATCLCYFCRDRYETVSIEKLSDALPEVEAFKTETTWGINLHVPLKMLRDAYGEFTLKEGDTVTMNLYKCGNKTKIPHYGTWSEICTERPDFHQPSCFSEVEIRRA